MRRTASPFGLVTFVALFTACAEQQALAPNPPVFQAGQDQVVQATTVVPISIDVFVPCALNGAGETVSLSGELHTLFFFTHDGTGSLHVVVENNPQGVSGTGLTSGDKYQGTGVTRSDFYVGLPSFTPFIETFVNNFRIIGEGTGNNLLIHETLHITVNANGEVTALFDNFSAECR